MLLWLLLWITCRRSSSTLVSFRSCETLFITTISPSSSSNSTNSSSELSKVFAITGGKWENRKPIIYQIRNRQQIKTQKALWITPKCRRANIVRNYKNIDYQLYDQFNQTTRSQKNLRLFIKTFGYVTQLFAKSDKPVGFTALKNIWKNTLALYKYF